MSTKPQRVRPDRDWEHYELHRRVRESLIALPAYFHTETHVVGLSATDVFTLGAVLGAAIEEQVVETLNRMRPVWDPDEEYLAYSFVRQSQAFPDILLMNGRRRTDRTDIVMGIELKGWYLLAKEGEPSFRYKVTPEACEPQDLLVVVPWILSDVISGTPKALEPYIESARYAAEYRNYYWQELRHTTTDTRIVPPADCCPYPSAREESQDRPAHDSGGNFGRIARTGLMDRYVADMDEAAVRGIAAKYWRAFFSAFQYEDRPEQIRGALDNLADEVVADLPERSDFDTERFRELLFELFLVVCGSSKSPAD